MFFIVNFILTAVNYESKQPHAWNIIQGKEIKPILFYVLEFWHHPSRSFVSSRNIVFPLDHRVIAFNLPPAASLDSPHFRLASPSPFSPRPAIILSGGSEETILDLRRRCYCRNDNSHSCWWGVHTNFRLRTYFDHAFLLLYFRYRSLLVQTGR